MRLQRRENGLDVGRVSHIDCSQWSVAAAYAGPLVPDARWDGACLFVGFLHRGPRVPTLL